MPALLTARLQPTARGPIEVCDTGGDGPVVLVVHGMPGDWRQGQTVAEDLAPQARVLLVSRPGYGRTPLSSGRAPAAAADLYAALLDALLVDRAVVLGISGGGPSSFAFAQQHPDRCAGLLLCCALQPTLMPVPAAMRRLAAVPGLWWALAGLSRLSRPPAPDPATFTEAERLQLEDPPVRDALLRFTRQTPSWTSGRGLRNDVRQLQAALPLSAAVVPAVVLHGDLDEVVPLAHAQDYAAHLPGARLEVLPGLGHAVPLFARARLAELLSSLAGVAR